MARVDEILNRLSIEQSKTELMLENFDKELSKLLETKFVGDHSLETIGRGDLIEKSFKLIKTIKTYETEINKICDEIEKHLTSDGSNHNNTPKNMLDITISACYETIVGLNAKLAKIQSEISSLKAEEYDI